MSVSRMVLQKLSDGMHWMAYFVLMCR